MICHVQIYGYTAYQNRKTTEFNFQFYFNIIDLNKDQTLYLCFKYNNKY